MRAIIIDDERLARTELKKLLQDFPEVEVIDEAANAQEGIQKIEWTAYDKVRKITYTAAAHAAGKAGRHPHQPDTARGAHPAPALRLAGRRIAHAEGSGRDVRPVA